MNAEQNFKKIEIQISCRNLSNMDYFSKSDPFVVFEMKNTQNNQWTIIGRTETIKDNLNPNFKKSFVIDYIFEVKQECRFYVRDDDGKNDFDDVGLCTTTVGALVGAKNNIYVSDIKNQKGQSAGKIVVLSEAVEECRDHLFMQWQGIKLKNVDGWFDKSDPFLRFKRVREDKIEFLCHETEVIMDNLNPTWKPFEISGQKLYNGDQYRPIHCECWDWQKNQNHQFIGEFQFCANDLIQGKREFEIVDHKKKKSGTIRLITFNLTVRPTFLDFVRGNTQLNVVLAVDFTASNGTVTSPQSLHYVNPNGQLNQYQQAMVTVGEILLDYDFDKKVPCFGFGGHPRYPGLTLNGVSHCFPMSGNPQDTDAFGINEMLNLYNYSLKNTALSGPTLFGPIISETIKLANLCKNQGSQVYTILLILTDGEIHDMDNTIDLIIEASNQPLSIIIVGVGSSEFENMEILDGDNGQLTGRGGRKPTRDLVQFVPYKKFNGNPILLAQQVLGEVPDQLVKYMMQQGIKPAPPQQINVTEVGMNQTFVGNKV